MREALWAVSPLDGRYRDKLEGLGRLVGEGGLIAYRLRIEAEWLLQLAETPGVREVLSLPEEPRRALEALIKELTGPEAARIAERVKEIERETNHDVKAVEYALRERLTAAGAPARVLAFTHFACTSEDINNLAYALMLDEVRRTRLLPLMDRIIADLTAKALELADLPMLARTHGQTATPTTLGKELAVFARRLGRQRDQLAAIRLEGKMNGAVGNYNAHVAAFPDVPWPKVARAFVEERLKLALNPLTTQIETHDTVVEYAQAIKRFNTVLLDLARDMWGYVSLGYFKQQTRAGEVGSSTMPHKVNPIDFENAEGNLGVASALADHFADKLPISRWQRDLSDSTVLRVLGTMIGHSELAYHSLLRGLGKVAPDPERIGQDLAAAVEVLAEPIQTVMRRYGVVDAYERLKAATRGKAVTLEALHALIDETTELPGDVKVALKRLTPESYTGLAGALTKEALKGAGG